MRRFLLLAVLSAVFAVSAAGQNDYVYTDASSLPLFGKLTGATAEPYSRLPLELNGKIRKGAWKQGRSSAGLFIRFTSDAGEFDFRWKSTMFSKLENMMGMGVRGMALYLLDGKEWVFLASMKPDGKKPESEAHVKASLLKGKTCEYMLYLSLYDGVEDLSIGIPEGYSLNASKLDSPRAEKPIIIYGTSILQGASATHPGTCGTAQLSRKADRVVINLGFSGNCYLEAPMAEYMASYPDPGMYILDNWNGAAEVGEKGLENCLRILLAAHPDTPILVVDRPVSPACPYDESEMDKFFAKRQVAVLAVEKLRKEGYRKIYHVTPATLGPDNSGTSDGTHFTDEAFSRWVDAIYPTVKKAYRKVR